MKIAQALVLHHGIMEGLSIALDGKTIRSTATMQAYESPLHIVSAQVSELGMSFAQKTVEGKSNEIPCMQELLQELNITGATIVCDALHCPKNTAEIIIKQKGEYVLSVKDNQPRLKEDIEGYVQDAALQKRMGSKCMIEKNRGRVEKRTAFVSDDINWIEDIKQWKNLACIGAIRCEVSEKGKQSEHWHYYISSKNLSVQQLLEKARKEWSVDALLVRCTFSRRFLLKL